MMRNQSIAGQCLGKHPYDTWSQANAARIQAAMDAAERGAKGDAK
jgi:hypothetical protein